MPNSPVLFDFSNASCGCTDHALEELYKALSDDPDKQDKLWRKHENLFIQKHVEDVTNSVGSILSNIQNELLDWLVSPKIKTQGKRQGLFKALESWRFSTSQAKDVLTYLKTKPRDQFTLDDWMLVVDLIINKYLPEDVIQTESEYLAIKSVLSGRVQAQMDEMKSDHKHIFSVVNGLPVTFAEAMELSMSPLEQMVIESAMAQSAMYITDLGEQTRKRIKSIIINYEEKIAYRDASASQWNLQQQLLDEFGFLNRDWRRVAITEIGENANQGFIGYLEPGSKVKRIEAYDGACPFCRKINDMVFDVVSPDKEKKDGWKEVWLGKSNVGRSASPRKRVGDELVERLDSERWWPSAGLQHPNCFISGNVPIYTDDGLAKISNINVGDKVLTHKGRFKAVTWVLDDKHYGGKVNCITVSYNKKNKKILPRMTPEHPVLTSLGWVKAGDIIPGDKIISLAKKCPTCLSSFVNLKHEDVIYCGNNCVPKSGENQFSTNDPVKYREAVSVTSKANIARMQGMTVEQRRGLTESAREASKRKGYKHLISKESRSKGNKRLALNNYKPSKVELRIFSLIKEMGFSPSAQKRIEQTTPNVKGRKRYWFPDISLVDQKICIEIDGVYWHKNRNDKERDDDLRKLGWDVLRFSFDFAKNNPDKVADSVCRLAMNHSGEYLFDSMEVVSNAVSTVKNVRLYNFSVEDDESYIISGGVVVHNCRGRWVKVIDIES